MNRTRQPGTPQLLRVLNDRHALELLISHGPLTRSQLGELTGLSKVTASQLVERLEARGLISKVGVVAGGRGPNAARYAVSPGSAYVVGVDIGPERAIAAAADITGVDFESASVDLDETASPVAGVHQAVVRAARRAKIPMDKIVRVVLGVPGVVDPASGDISFSWDLPRWHRGLASALREDLRHPVTIENDVNLAAFAESQVGAAQGVDDFVLFWVGRGIGSAVFLSGRLHRGATGGAGEIGYLPAPGQPVPQGVTRRSKPSFQRSASAEAVRALARSHGLVADTASEALRLAVGNGTGSSVEFLDELAHRLAFGVAAVAVVIDPALVVLAGDVGRAGGPALASRVGRDVRTMAPVSPQVVVTSVNGDAVLRGALLTGLDAARDELFTQAP